MYEEIQQTHHEECWRNPRHHACAVAKIEALLAASATRPAVIHTRAPTLDRRIAAGDEFDGDAFVRWCKVGYAPVDRIPETKAKKDDQA